MHHVNFIYFRNLLTFLLSSCTH